MRALDDDLTVSQLTLQDRERVQKAGVALCRVVKREHEYIVEEIVLRKRKRYLMKQRTDTIMAGTQRRARSAP